MSKVLLASVSAVTFLIGMGVGFSLTPEYAQMQSVERAAMSMDLGRADKYLDVRYVDGMIAHHQAAIYLAEQAKKSHKQEIRDLAETIIKADTEDIKKLYQYKKDWYNNTKSVEQYQQINLGAVDEKFDLRFLNALIAHHEEAIMVAKDVQTKSTRTEVLTIADSVITNLGKGIEQLAAWRKEWYGI